MKKASYVLGVAIFALMLIPHLASADTANGITVKTDTNKDIYEEGEDIRITITARNNSSQSKTLYFNSGCQVSYSVDGYNSSDHQFCTQSLTAVTSPGFSSKSWSLTHRASDHRIDDGDYVLTGRVIGYASDSRWISVEDDDDNENDNDIEVTSPDDGDRWKIGDREKIRWEFDEDKEEVNIRLIPKRSGWTPYTIVKDRKATSYTWKVGKVRDHKSVRKGDYRIKICLLDDDDICDTSDYFKIR